ncbi:Hypothetical_protein [Hexamita inflata]|uniref:Hypothetical_protein n=1 Tax=Hexamita inflata TaxID=28002 RepID=A0AA86NID5_9EUKA|nr:Hypothetical protein HINF_LOCUS7234 [Hexamita inflata]
MEQNSLEQLLAHEETIQKIFFYNKELALKTLFFVTTIKITHAHAYWCNHHKTYITTSQKVQDTSEQYERTKNNCTRRAGIERVKGTTYYKHKNDYKNILFVMNEDSKIFPLCEYDKQHTYCYIRISGNHDSNSNNPCLVRDFNEYFSSVEGKSNEENIINIQETNCSGQDLNISQLIQSNGNVNYSEKSGSYEQFQQRVRQIKIHDQITQQTNELRMAEKKILDNYVLKALQVHW